jgi:hypothetical protein
MSIWKGRGEELVTGEVYVGFLRLGEIEGPENGN